MFDVETFFTKFYLKMKEQLNLKIAAINTEKGDELLTNIADEAWILMSLIDKVKNFIDFAFGQIDNVKTVANGRDVSKEITLEFDLFIAVRNDGLDANGIDKDELRILRYWRALEEAAKEAWNKVGVGYGKSEIESLTPIDIKLTDSAHQHKLCGISVSFTING